MGKSITDLSSVTTVGLDLAKHVFHVPRTVTARATMTVYFHDTGRRSRGPRISKG